MSRSSITESGSAARDGDEERAEGNTHSISSDESADTEPLRGSESGVLTANQIMQTHNQEVNNSTEIDWSSLLDRVWLRLGVETVKDVQASERILNTALDISICAMLLFLLIHLLLALLNLRFLSKQLTWPEISFVVPEGKCSGQQVVVQSCLCKMRIPIPTGARAGQTVTIPILRSENRVILDEKCYVFQGVDLRCDVSTDTYSAVRNFTDAMGWRSGTSWESLVCLT